MFLNQLFFTNILFWYLIWSNLTLIIFFWNWKIQICDKNILCIVFICSNSRVIRSNFSSRVAHRLEDNSHFSRVYSLIKFGKQFNNYYLCFWSLFKYWNIPRRNDSHERLIGNGKVVDTSRIVTSLLSIAIIFRTFYRWRGRGGILVPTIPESGSRAKQ